MKNARQGRWVVAQALRAAAEALARADAAAGRAERVIRGAR